MLYFFADFYGSKGSCILTFVKDNHLPWPSAKKSSDVKMTEISEYQKSWRRRVDINMGYYIGQLIIFISLHTIYKFPLKHVEGPIPDFFRASGAEAATIYQPGSILQLTACHTQLMVIVGLCLDGGQSLTARFFSTSPMQFLGRISMAYYLVHGTMIMWINLCIYGPVEGERQEWVKFPLWATPVMMILSVLFATFLTLCLEEPLRKKLKALYVPENSNKFCILGTVFVTVGVVFTIIGVILFTVGVLPVAQNKHIS